MASGPSPAEPDPKATLPADQLAGLLASRFGPATAVTPLAPDASVRSFFRLERKRGKSRVALVDGAGGPGALDRMVAARDLLSSIGVRVPRVEDRDDAIPALLFEDFGDVLLADALPSLTAPEKLELYNEAGRIAGKIAKLGTNRVGDDHALRSPELGYARLRWELALFATQDVAGRRAVVDHELFRRLAEFSDRVCREITAGPAHLAHRDFHARNLMLLPGAKPGARLGVVDFQDTLFAPPYYDLASLVRDPYVDPDPALERAAIAGYAAATKGALDPLEDPLFSWVALQRDLKAIGTYSTQARLRRRERFLAYVAPAERLARRASRSLPADDVALAAQLLDDLNFAS